MEKDKQENIKRWKNFSNPGGHLAKKMRIIKSTLSKFIINPARKHKKKLILVLLVGLVLTISMVSYLNRFKPIEFLQNVDFDIYLVLLASAVVGTFIHNIFVTIYSRWHKLARFKLLASLKLTVFLNIGVIVMFVLIFGLGYVKKHPKIISTNPNEEAYLTTYDQKINVKFNVPVQIEKLSPSITPAIEGKWEWEPYLGITGLTREGYFIMDKTPFPEERFVAYIAGINKLTDSQEHEHGFVFYAPKIPTIVSSVPKDGASNIEREPEIRIDFSDPVRQSIDLEFITEPEFKFDYSFLSENILEIKLLEPLSQSTDYKLIVKRYPKSIDPITGETIEQKEALEEDIINFKTVKEPGISEITPTGNYALNNSEIKMIFDLDMDQESVESRLTIEPEIAYTTAWDDASTLRIIPSAVLPKDTEFKIMLSEGIKSEIGGVVESEISHTFKTIGPIKVKSITPGGNASNVDETQWVQVEFDQAVNKESAQSHFSITPKVNGSFGWSGNTMQFKPSRYALGTKYTVRILSGIESIDGLQSVDEYTSVFTTRPNAVYINIPMYLQTRRFSCNINTARMILGWKNKGVPGETSLIAEIGYNDNRANDQWTGNPYKEFVGTADGNWGYGVYHPPIAKILSARGISTSVRQNWNVTALLKEVQEGRPVIVWRYNGVGGGQNISWTASDGTYVYAYNGMHGSVVSGFVGTPENPSSIRINDPWLGQLWLTKSSFDWYWSFSGRTALIIY